MTCRLSHIRSLRIALGLTVALGLGLARSEKVWAECLTGLPSDESSAELLQLGHQPFDPRRVPQSGGMASRLLAGIAVKHG